jgi:ubiquinol-cytochrome c reductase cytochrome b subunit
MHYAADTAIWPSTRSKSIMRDVNYGWHAALEVHANGASFFFIAVYIHIARGMYYGSYKAPREILWMLGVAIFFIMMATVSWVTCCPGAR